MGMLKVDLVCGEMNTTINSVRPRISSNTPTYFPPPASTIEDISISLNRARMAFPFLVLGRSAPRGARSKQSGYRTRTPIPIAGLPFFVFHPTAACGRRSVLENSEQLG